MKMKFLNKYFHVSKFSNCTIYILLQLGLLEWELEALRKYLKSSLVEKGEKNMQFYKSKRYNKEKEKGSKWSKIEN